MSTPAERDQEEWKSARAQPLPRHGQPWDHPTDCYCRPCLADRYEPGDWR